MSTCRQFDGYLHWPVILDRTEFQLCHIRLLTGDKARARDRPLPLPHDVGRAIASYLQDGRPELTCRRIFLRSRAPFDGLGSHSDICQIVRRAIARAGIELDVTGSHQLRHALAVDMLRQGLSLTEIGQMLRHRSPDATRRYAKVDLEGLREVALPWPGELP